MGIIRWVFRNMPIVFAVVAVAVVIAYWDVIRSELVARGIVGAPAPQAAETDKRPPAASAPTLAAAPAAPRDSAVQPAPAVQTQTPAAAPAPSVAAVRPALSDGLQRDLAAARAAYWQRDMNKAVELYEALAKASPDQADVHGELGNVYLAMGKRDEAAKAYAAAGDLLVKSATPMAAGKAMMALRMLAPEKAEELRRKIYEASNPAAR